MIRAAACFLLLLTVPLGLPAQQQADPVAQALAQGDLYQSKRKYQLALDAYHKADKLAHHNSAICLLKLAAVERKLGDFSSALDDAKRAVKAGGSDKKPVIDAHLMRATLLVQMAGKPTDKKLKQAEEEIREALALDATEQVAHFDLGMVLLKQERDGEGVAELQSFLATPRVDAKLAEDARRCIASPIRAREPFAPDFSFTAEGNEKISNASLRGKVALLDFWGTWCPPCRESVPTLREVQKKYAGKAFQLVSVSSDDDEEVWRTFVEAQRMNWSEYIDLSGNVLETFHVDSFPTYIVLDKDGVIRFRQSGFGEDTRGDLEDAINKALKRPSNPALAAAAASSTAASSVPPASTASPAAGSVAGGVPANTEKRAEAGIAAPRAASGGTEAAALPGNVYLYEELGLRYEFPKGWAQASTETLRGNNERVESAARASILQQHPEMGANVRIMVPKVIFYASQRGDGDGHRLSFPCVRITASESRVESLKLETFQRMIESMATASGAKVTSPASEFRVKEHSFLRADLERSLGGSHIYQSYVQTLAGDSLLTIEIYALSADELQRAAGSLQSMTIKDEEGE